LRELGYEESAKKVQFWQGDACNLKPTLRGYDLVMATNLIDRLYNPYLFLETIHERMNDDGVLVLTSPYTWQEESTPKELWLGGYYDANGKEVRTFERLKEILGEHFEFVHREDVEFVIKETARKFEHSVAELSVWRKKSV
jgi:putative 4-mercaptohistidine N1-methyltranferase